MEHNNPVIKIAVVDDQLLLRKGIIMVITSFTNCHVIAEAGNGKELVTAIKEGKIPDVIILDLSMPVMDGFSTAEWLFKHHPVIKILILSMYDSELNMIRLLRYGVKGFLKKDIAPSELQSAIEIVIKNGFYYSPHASNALVSMVRSNLTDEMQLQQIILSDREIEFLKLSATDRSYKEIGQAMGLNPRSIEHFREDIFAKLGVQSRVGLAMIAIKQGLVTF